MKIVTRLAFVVLPLLLFTVCPARAQHQLIHGQIGGGGGFSEGSHVVHQTIAQGIVGVSAGPVMSINSGFWYCSETGWSVSILFQLSTFLAEIRDDIATLVWEAHGAAFIDGFHVYRSETAGGQFERLTLVPLEPRDLVVYRDETALGNTTYHYMLGALSLGETWYSHTVALSLPRRPTTLYRNFPNPFNPATTLVFYLESPSRTQLAIYDLRGTRVSTLLDETMPAGRHSLVWNGVDSAGRQVGSGVYICRLVTDHAVLVERLLLLK